MSGRTSKQVYLFNEWNKRLFLEWLQLTKTILNLVPLDHIFSIFVFFNHVGQWFFCLYKKLNLFTSFNLPWKRRKTVTFLKALMCLLWKCHLTFLSPSFVCGNLRSALQEVSNFFPPTTIHIISSRPGLHHWYFYGQKIFLSWTIKLKIKDLEVNVSGGVDIKYPGKLAENSYK